MWVIIILVGVALLVTFEVIKFEHHAKRIKMIFLVIIVLLLYLSIVGVNRTADLDLSSPSGLVNAAGVYFTWIGDTVVNLWDVGVDTVKMTGNAIRGEDKDKDS